MSCSLPSVWWQDSSSNNKNGHEKKIV